ncbi:MAG: hypothetical protein V3R25_09240 [Nitrosomonadaceae bacterium]
MPVAKIQLQDGRIARFDVPEGTTQEQVMSFVNANQGQFQQQPIEQPVQQPVQQPIQQGPRVPVPSTLATPADVNLQDPTFKAGRFEPAVTLASSILAEPIAGVAGIAQAINPFAEEGAGGRAVEATRKALTFVPRSESGQQALGELGETLKPVGEAIEAVETGLGDATLSATGSPALAAAAATLPTAVFEALGLGIGKKVAKIAKLPKLKKLEKLSAEDVDKALVESAPDIERIKETSRAIYKELDDSGITLREKAARGLIGRMEKTAKEANVDDVLTPDTARAIKLIKERLLSGKRQTLTDMDNMRKIAQQAAQSPKSADASAALRIIDDIDTHLDSLSSGAFRGGKTAKTTDINTRYKAARNLWGRARRAELMSDALDKARLQASGFENGIRNQLRQILTNKKKRRFFTKEEVDAMSAVVEGSSEQNILKLIGRFGFSEGQATTALGGAAGLALGGAVGGRAGAVAAGLIGQFSKKAAQRATKRGADLAEAVIKSKNNAKQITEAYLRLTPKNKRTILDLSDLLTDPNVNIDKLLKSSDKLIKEAAEIAKGRRAFLTSQAAGALAPAATTGEQ